VEKLAEMFHPLTHPDASGFALSPKGARVVAKNGRACPYHKSSGGLQLGNGVYRRVYPAIQRVGSRRNAVGRSVAQGPRFGPAVPPQRTISRLSRAQSLGFALRVR
jgi:hypothetical protein